MTINTIAIIGAGTMGLGIAQIAAQAGIKVLLFDAKLGEAERKLQSLAKTLKVLAEKGKFTQESINSTLSNLLVVNELSQISKAELVIEAIIEDLSIKQQLFANLEAIVSPEAILATNTSSLSVTAIASKCQYPQRVAGYHFFNPVPLMKVVEVISGLSTKPSVIDTLINLAKRMGHLGVTAKDTPGFIVNHAGRAYGTEALKILGENIADFMQIDTILTQGVGFRMGPFELMDLTGLDVSHPVMESIYNQYYQEPRYRPHPLTRQMLNGNKLGRKVGEGFYRYEEGRKVLPYTPSLDEPKRDPTSVWVGADIDEDKERIINYLIENNIPIDKSSHPNSDSLVLLAIYGEDTTDAALRYEVNARQVVAIDPLLDFQKHCNLMPSIVTDKEFTQQALSVFSKETSNNRDKDISTSVTIISESPGFVAQRVLSMIINLACDMAAQHIATPKDIDNAVKIGLGYPYGPIEWGDKLGPQRILLILERLLVSTGDPRYRPSSWLYRRAKLGISLFTQQRTF